MKISILYRQMLILFSFCIGVTSYSQNEDHWNLHDNHTDQDTIHTTVFVDGICGMCKDRIEALVSDFPKIMRADWNDHDRLLNLWSMEEFDIEALEKSIAAAGHDTEHFQADQQAYENLDPCCLYRDPDIIEAHGYDAESRITPYHEGWNTDFLQAIILERNQKGKEIPVVGANVYWSGTTSGGVTDADGYVRLELEPDRPIVVSYVGFENDTLDVSGKRYLEIILSDATLMREVTITHRKRATDVSWLTVNKVQNIGEKELLKAACCNLSESFETNPTIDASLTDAVTGTRQIHMLGLAGPNIQMTREGVPDIRGLTSIYGLTFTPGPWIEGIQINTGAGSVINGFESIAGQIDVSLKKPDHSDRFYLNLYGNEMSRMEGNILFSHKLSDKASTGIMLHGSLIPTRHDINHDGFLDHPVNDQFVGLNRWKFYGKNGLEGQVGIKMTSLNSLTGQAEFDPELHKGGDEYWGAQIQLRKYEAWGKIGKVFPSRPYSSIGLVVGASYFEMDNYFGQRTYAGDQSSFYSNLIYESIITDSRHKFKTGLSFQLDRYDEEISLDHFERKEVVPGAFFEYSYLPDERFSMVAGLRADHHNQFGFFVTPRLHMRYMPSEGTVFRMSGGRGQRTASIFAENLGAFASSRTFVVHGSGDDSPYGLDAEVSWTAGAGFQKEWMIGTRSLLFQLDYYYTGFENQIVADFDESPQELHFYNLDGKSFSSSLQAQIDYELFTRLNVRLAWRFNDVRTTYGDQLMEKPLTGRHRAFLNVQYQTENGWSFDYTLNWRDGQRLPSTVTNPEPHRLAEFSPSYTMSNAQISKSWNDRFDVYVGAVNLFHYRQDHPILSADQPFSPYFDSSIIWAPVFGREIYGGIRYRVVK